MEVSFLKHKWLIAAFAAVFLIAVAAGITLRFAAQGENREQEISSPPQTSAEELPEGVPANTVAVSTAPPETTSQPVETEPEVTTPVETEPAPEPEESGTVRICIGGDTSIDGEFADFAAQKGVDYPWEEISGVMGEADIAIVNLETCVSDGGVSEKREGYGFRTPPEMLEGFVNAGIDAVNLANNHTRDFGYDALLDTFENLAGSGIEYFGAGNDLDEAQGLLIIEKNGVKIGFTGANRVYLANDCAAREDHAGVNQIGGADSASTLAYIEKLREYDSMCDVLIVFLHAGEEEVFEVSDYQKKVSRSFIDAGADIVVGGHSHTLQPIEFYNGKPIFYSIGNLIFWHIDDDIDGLTAIFDITVDKGGFVSLKLHPLFIKNYKVYYLKEGEGKFGSRYPQIIELLNSLCNPYGLAFDGEGNMTEYVAPPEEPEAAE